MLIDGWQISIRHPLYILEGRACYIPRNIDRYSSIYARREPLGASLASTDTTLRVCVQRALHSCQLPSQEPRCTARSRLCGLDYSASLPMPRLVSQTTHTAMVCLAKDFITPSPPADITFSKPQYTVDEESGPLAISLRAELNKLLPTENVVVTITLAASRAGENSATPYGTGGSG